MQHNNQKISALRDLLDYDALSFITAEVHLEKNVKRWINEATSLQLKTVLQKYLVFIHEHEQNINAFYESEKINAVTISNRIVQAYIDDTNDKLARCQDAEVKDACLSANIQAINHYKISAYGTAAAFASALEMDKQADAFRKAEINEKQIDDRLTQLAQFEINLRAKAPIVLQG